MIKPLALQLRSPLIINVFGAVFDEQTLILVMDLVSALLDQTAHP